MKKLTLFLSLLLLVLVQTSLVSAVHLPPGSANSTVNIDFRSAILTNGLNQTLAIWVRTWNSTPEPAWGRPNSFFTFNRLPENYTELYVLAKNLSGRFTNPAIICRNSTGSLSYCITRIGGPDPCLMRMPDQSGVWFDAVYNGEPVYRTFVWFHSHWQASRFSNLYIYSGENRIYVELYDINTFAMRCGNLQGGKWIITFNKQRYPYTLVVENVQYSYFPFGPTINVHGGFVSPTGSMLRYYRGLLPTRNVLIEYAYPR